MKNIFFSLTIGALPVLGWSQAPTPRRGAAAPVPVQNAKPAPSGGPRSAVISFEGFVEVQHNGQARQRVTAVPRLLRSGDQIRTHARSKAVVQLREGSQISLGPNSFFILEDETPAKITLTLNLGKLWAAVTKLADRQFEIQTPVALAAVRGTEFSVEAMSARQAAVEVFGGAVAVKGAAAGEALLLSNQRVDIMDGNLGRPEKFEPTPADLGAIRQSRQAQGQKVEADEGKDKEKQSQADTANDDLKASLEREVGFQLGRDAVESAAAFEMKNALYQSGKDIIDAFGQRVQVEQYITRPTPSSFKYVALNTRANRFDFGLFEVVANAPLPDDLSQVNDLWFSPGSTPPAYFAVQQRFVFSNTQDSITGLDVDGRSQKMTFQQPGTPICGTNGCVFGPATPVTFYQTIFGNRYEFINGNPNDLNAIWSNGPGGRLADYPGMMWHTNPVHFNITANPGGLLLADYWDDAFMNTGAAPNIGKAFNDSFLLPDPNLAHFIDRRDYLKYSDGTGRGFLNAGDQIGISGAQFGLPGNVDVKIDLRYNGVANVAVPAAAAVASSVFADNLNNNTPGGANPTLNFAPGVTIDPSLLANKSNTWQQGENFLIDDFGKVINFNTLNPDNQTSNGQLFEQLNFERSMASSVFPGRKIDVVMDPSFFIDSAQLSPQ